MADDQTPSEGLTGSLFDRIKGFFTSMLDGVLGNVTGRIKSVFSAGGNILAGKFGDKGVEYLTESLAKSIDRLDFTPGSKATYFKCYQR